MERIKMRPWSAAALAGSLVWILLCIYEVWIRDNGPFSEGPGTFLKLEGTIQLATTGVVGLALLAWLIERVWPPAGQ
jgi:hypothetical protein